MVASERGRTANLVENYLARSRARTGIFILGGVLTVSGLGCSVQSIQNGNFEMAATWAEIAGAEGGASLLGGAIAGKVTRKENPSSPKDLTELQPDNSLIINTNDDNKVKQEVFILKD